MACPGWMLWEGKSDVGASEAIHIISSYRSPETNSMLRRRSRGRIQVQPAPLGKAIDSGFPVFRSRIYPRRGACGCSAAASVTIRARSFMSTSATSVTGRACPRPSSRASFRTASAAGAGYQGRARAGRPARVVTVTIAKLLGIGKDNERKRAKAQRRAAASLFQSRRPPVPRDGRSADAARAARTGGRVHGGVRHQPSRAPERASPAPAGEFGLASATSRPARLSEPAPAAAGEFTTRRRR